MTVKDAGSAGSSFPDLLESVKTLDYRSLQNAVATDCGGHSTDFGF